MKSVHLSFADSGGAGIAAGRSVDALRLLGWDAKLLTAASHQVGSSIRGPRLSGARLKIDAAVNRLYSKREFFSSWSNNITPSFVSRRIDRERADIVHLHWIGGALVSLRDVSKIRSPVVWTLHDPWAVTGGCHYPHLCERWAQQCGCCPQLGSSQLNDLSAYNRRKKVAFASSVAAFISPSMWLANLVLASGVVLRERVHVIPNGVDAQRYEVVELPTARRALGLSLDTLVFAAGAADLGERRKGSQFLGNALSRVAAQTKRRVTLVLFGSGKQEVDPERECEVRYIGEVRNDRDFAVLFGAADALILPSLQDNLPNIALEALACGCPIIGFPSGGLVEIVDDSTGEIAKDISDLSLSDAILSWLSRSRSRHTLARVCRERFESQFSIELHGKRLDALYREICSSAKSHPLKQAIDEGLSK